MKEIIIIPGKCDNCGDCITACINAGYKSRGRKKHRARIEKSRIVIRKIGDTFHPFFCCHCLEAPCVDVCISGAMKQDSSTGRVTVDSEQCVACWSCVMSCPFGAVSPQKKNQFALKCDVCEDEILPCVRVCKPGALIQSKRQADLTKLTARANAAARSLRFARSDSGK